MKKTFYFIRSAPYEYKFSKYNLYVSFDMLAKRKIDPPLRKGAKIFIKENISPKLFNKNVYFDPAKRSKQSAIVISKNRRELKVLSEIKYSMKSFISENEFYKNGEPDVRSARIGFVHAFINNKLEERYSSVIKRIEIILSRIKLVNESEVILISHGFFLKLFEAYIKNPKIKTDPKLLLNYFTGEKEAFKFCEGFKIEFDGKRFKFKKYLRNVTSSNI